MVKQKNILITFLFAFSIIQNSKTKEVFEESFKGLYNVFNLQTQNDLFQISLNNIKSKLAEREDD